MTCFICEKKYSRLSQHLTTKHKIHGTSVEPNTMKHYVHLLMLLTPFELKLTSKYREELRNYFENNKDLPSDLYRKLEKALHEYKENHDMKLVIKIAHQSQKPRKQRKTRQVMADTMDES